MLTIVAAQYRIQWETFTIQDAFAVDYRFPTNSATVSDGMADLILSQRTWTGIRKIDSVTGKYGIGYGVGDPDDVQGYTESQAYAEWIGDLHNRQKRLVAQLPLSSITQTIFDALLSLYIDTGTWRTVRAEEGTYDLATPVKNGNWLLVADIISRGKINGELRKKEARVMRLADYSFTKTRNQQVIQGVQLLRTQYVAGIANEFDKKQAEFVYFRQFGTFLPGMSQLRQRRVIAQART
jgi:phage FluMu protein gp41